MQSVEFMKKKINDFKVNYELMIGRDRFRKSSKTTLIYLTTDMLMESWHITWTQIG